jgi:hypothetical protein
MRRCAAEAVHPIGEVAECDGGCDAPAWRRLYRRGERVMPGLPVQFGVAAAAFFVGAEWVVQHGSPPASFSMDNEPPGHR